jgi:hypothetical protein
MRSAAAILVAAAALVVAAPASPHSTRVEQAKKTYYHANGYIKAIGKNARRTIYHPNLSIRRRWQRDLRYLIKIRDRAWATMHPAPKSDWLDDAFMCIHRYEGAWNANTGNGYHGGLQMDSAFQALYGPDFVRQWGAAENWPVWAQIEAAKRAYRSGRGFYPWPNTARACGLL